MSKPKTDWQIAVSLRDFIISLGEFKHDTYKNGEKQHYGADGVKLYTDGKYVSCSIVVKGKDTNEINIGSNHWSLPDVTDECQNITDIALPDIRKLSKLYRRRLAPMVTTTKQRVADQKKDEIKALRSKIKELETQ